MVMISLFVYLMGILALLINRFHLIMVLMSIEFMYMSLTVLMMILFSLLNVLNIFLFLVSLVCEAALGLSLLVLLNFYYGNEMLNAMNLIKC
uniref:NADH-ubiquinone oxidoreductase chain 4L n=2 Tax=Amblyomma TaxID=6942 RepID=L7PC65_AMBCJ|nr:NADH dehydrogenase subunit 4L [Amblyomma cajennense]YP_009332020.1 NADH dehydrogenase subunit 4L [Amblyomma sculptum]AFU55274.1 NADH dehydrogenase subunit 4L [Amblyomma cajennense]APH07717.1 NADH dehydrogenase subunit 4L [Amblyomma sculptum]WEF75037.1 NADH dehydrogenase subunit 4L [Amblyomma sculptum]